MNRINEKDQLRLDCIADPIQNLINWRDSFNAMPKKKLRPQLLKKIKMHPEFFEQLKEHLSPEDSLSVSDRQVAKYFGVPFEIVPELKKSFECIYIN
ncbi:hypothetical protein KDC22_14415 [Paenibacillus tritici]|uniref:hypothetical protein n=1 Tax=Paenibacillus tritici TaxID=1873425 RepID=UPI001BA8F050|nr:hypothetical protein [Paenibacillus tritici]QUL57560.1 hypothetical protein KDC22_14415 [Paenibacillus tritici]